MTPRLCALLPNGMRADREWHSPEAGREEADAWAVSNCLEGYRGSISMHVAVRAGSVTEHSNAATGEHFKTGQAQASVV